MKGQRETDSKREGVGGERDRGSEKGGDGRDRVTFTSVKPSEATELRSAFEGHGGGAY